MRKRHGLILLLALAACSSAAESGTPAAKAEPALAPDKDLLAKIEALPDNTWLKLPPLKVTGDMGVLDRNLRQRTEVGRRDLGVPLQQTLKQRGTSQVQQRDRIRRQAPSALGRGHRGRRGQSGGHAPLV